MNNQDEEAYMQNIILIPILCVLVGWFIHIRYKEVSRKRTKSDQEYSNFAEPLSHFITSIQDKKVHLNYALSTEFENHRLLKDIFIMNLRGHRLRRFNEKWAQYEEHYQEVAKHGAFGIGAAIAPSLEALQGATPDDPPNWEAAKKKEVHSIISELLKIAKVKIWF